MAKYRISGVPVVDTDGRLIGIITNRDMKFEENMDRLISEVMTSEGLVTGREGTTLEEAKDILRRHKIEKLPIVDDNFREVYKRQPPPPTFAHSRTAHRAHLTPPAA